MNQTRRQWLASVAAATAFGQPSRKPNVILIVADDLGYADLGCYGQKEILTPNIDRLAAEGLRFTQAYAGSTVCAPSRCALMTGRHTGHATVRGNVNPHVPLTAEETTVAQIFERAGYQTGAFGKWGLGIPPDMHALPTRKGFNTFYGYLHQVHAHTYYPDMLWNNEREEYLPQNFGGARTKYSHDLIAARALQFIDENRDRPFFMYAPFTLPHGRFEPPNDEPYSAKSWPPPARMLAAMITRLDNTVGQIMERLKRHSLERDTLIIFTSDNGPVKLGVDHFRSNGPFRGYKRDLYEGGIRVPFIARWLGRIQPGTSDEVLASWDLLPTFAQLTDQTAPEGLDGVPALKALLGTGPAPDPDRHLYWEFHERGFQQAVRWRKWKAVRDGEQGRVELYDLAADPGEKNDLAATEQKVAAHMTALLNGARTHSELWIPKRPPIRGSTL